MERQRHPGTVPGVSGDHLVSYYADDLKSRNRAILGLVWMDGIHSLMMTTIGSNRKWGMKNERNKNDLWNGNESAPGGSTYHPDVHPGH